MRLAIALITYQRTACALATIAAVREHLRYEDRAWYVADDGSAPEHGWAIMEALRGEEIIGHHSERMGVGVNQNRALAACFAWADQVLFLEDDWELRAVLDPEPYLQVLGRNPAVGMIRLGCLAVGSRCDVVGYEGRHYLRMDRATQYAFSGNPSLRHRRLHDWYGGYRVGLSPGDTELAFDGEFRARGGPDILWPVEIGGWGLFGHIGTTKTETML